MRLYTFQTDGLTKVGVERDGQLVDLSTLAPNMLSLIRGGDTMLDAARGILTSNHAVVYKFSNVKLLAPLKTPGKMLCSGLNYYSHTQENPNAVLPTEPDVFIKVSSAIIGPNEEIVIPPMSQQVDYEVEFAVVIGQALAYTPPERVMEKIFGYTIVHDVSARDVQFKPNG